MAYLSYLFENEIWEYCYVVLIEMTQLYGVNRRLLDQHDKNMSIVSAERQKLA